MKSSRSTVKLVNKGDAHLSSLRSYSKRRVLVDMVENVRRHSRFSSEYLVLVVDNAALKIFSSCC